MKINRRDFLVLTTSLVAGCGSASAADLLAGYGKQAARRWDPTRDLGSDPDAFDARRTVSLAGEWLFAMGKPRLQEHPGALPSLRFSDRITLPGTTDTNRKGRPSDVRSTYSLTQPWHFEGVCWYRRSFTLPAAWRQKRITLVLERTKYSQVWLDGRPVGEQAVFLTEQEYELGRDLAAGRHTLTIAVDNSRLPPFGVDAHQFSENTQGNWNGIIGRIELRMTDLAWIRDAQVHPEAGRRRIRVRVDLGNLTGKSGTGRLRLRATGPGIGADAALSADVAWEAGGASLEMPLPLGPDAALWDEFHPALHRLAVRLEGPHVRDERRVTFGLRDFAARGRQFAVNGRPVFLRGKHDACVFPLTGCPPMDVDSWLHYFRICRSYGLNHVRFHTWVPPEAAFEAADRLGFYLQPELPFWGAFDERARAVWEPEAKRLTDRMGHHPSFVMFSMGNELWAGAGVLASLVADLHAHDPRILYVRGTNAFTGECRPGRGDDYYIGSEIQPDPHGPKYQIRGSFGLDERGHVQRGPADTLADYAAAIEGAEYPVISHEMGQYTVFPDFRQTSKYVGATRAYNLAHFQKMLARAGLADEDPSFARASGALAALCYREDIESCLRTPNYGGFELLDLVDYPGQGTALVGMLDAFMDSKGILTPEQWRRFCAPAVLLARFPKYTWTQNETFAAEIELAHYGAEDLAGAVLTWALKDAGGGTLRSGELPPADLARGNVRPVGRLAIPLEGLAAPARLQLELRLKPAGIATGYPLWIYPRHVETAPPANVTLVRVFDADAEKALADGRRVLLVCDGSKPLARTVCGGFATDFWSFQYFHDKPGTMGVWCDPASPALARFPTESHSNWQWFPIALHAQPLVLDAVAPPADRPIVQMVDNCARDHRLGLVFEFKVGPGRLLACASDLVDLGREHPAARQLLASLLAYAASERFDPRPSVAPEALRELFRTQISMDGCKATASGYDPGWQGFAPLRLIDGNESRGWRADPKARGEVWCQVEFPRPTDVGACEILWDRPGYRYVVQSSADGSRWHVVSDQRAIASATARQTLRLDAAGVKYLRLTISGTPDHRPAAVEEIRFFAPE